MRSPLQQQPAGVISAAATKFGTPGATMSEVESLRADVTALRRFLPGGLQLLGMAVPKQTSESEEKALLLHRSRLVAALEQEHNEEMEQLFGAVLNGIYVWSSGESHKENTPVVLRGRDFGNGSSVDVVEEDDIILAKEFYGSHASLRCAFTISCQEVIESKSIAFLIHSANTARGESGRKILRFGNAYPETIGSIASLPLSTKNDICRSADMYHPLQVTPLQSLSPSSSSAPSLPTAVSASLSRPFTTDGKGPGSFSISVDILMFAHCEDRIDRCLGKLKDLMQMRFDSLKQTSLELNRSLKMYHFHAPMMLHPSSVAYPSGLIGDEENDFSPMRTDLHIRFGLPTDRPLFRVINARSYNPSEVDPVAVMTRDGRLLNVHETLARQMDAKSCTLYLVDGAYAYYHYRQDRINDDSWGCAYRSLQTLCSWYLLQAYTTRLPPSHEEIQQTLVQVKDKPKKFIGSKQWIGAIEISLVLDELYKVQCRIIRVNSGPDIYYKSRELATHFSTEGTPIMIGGGVLAWTLLGIDWSEKTGDVRYLILDPHYTGKDTLQTITNKGWVGWKKVDVFRKDAFYNFLLPQRPKKL